eukprot:345932_1
MAEMSTPRHKRVIFLNNCLTGTDTTPLKHKLGKGDWSKILERINNKITKKWKLSDETQYSFSIQHDNTTIAFDKEDTEKLQSVLSNMSSPITLNIISPQNNMPNKADDTKEKEKEDKHSLIFHYGTHKLLFPLSKGFDAEDERLFKRIMNIVERRLKISGTIEVFDLDECAIVCMDDVATGLEDSDPLHLKIKCKPNDIDSDQKTEIRYPDLKKKAKTPVILMKECPNDKVQAMVHFDEKIRAKIYQNYRCDIRKNEIKSEQLNRVLEGLNTARPRMEENYDKLPTEFQDVITFWQRYAEICLIQSNVETCINARVAINTELYQSDELEGSEGFENHYETIQEIARNYHQLRQNANKSAFDALLTLIISIKIEIKPEQRPMDPDTLLNEDEFVIAKEDVTPKHRTKDAQYRVYLYLDQPTSNAYVEFTTLFTGFHRMISARPNSRLFYLDVHLPWQHHQHSTKVKFAFEGRNRSRISIDAKTRLFKGTPGYYWIQLTSAWYNAYGYVGTQKEKAKAANQILHHIINQTDNTYESYRFGFRILNGFKNSLQFENNYRNQLWQQLWLNQVKGIVFRGRSIDLV